MLNFLEDAFVFLKNKEKNILDKNKKKVIKYIHLLTASSIFCYAVLYSSLFLYLTDMRRMPVNQASSYVGIFISFNFLLHLFAGYISEKFISSKNLLILAMMAQFISILIILYTSYELYVALSLFLLGSGFGITCLYNILISLFDTYQHNEREKAFFINYSFLNAGLFLGFLTSGYFYSIDHIKILFQISSIFNIFSLFILYKFQKLSKNINNLTPYFSFVSKLIGIILIFLLLIFMFMGFNYREMTNLLFLFISFFSFLYLAIYALRSKEVVETKKICIFLLFLISGTVFWTLYFIGPMGFIYFLKNNVNRSVYNYLIPPQWFMNLDTLLIIIGSPLFLYIFQCLENKKIYISVAKKISFSLISISCAYFVLFLGIRTTDINGTVNIIWIIIYYIFQSIGELLLAPVGLSMIGKLAPRRLQGMMLGAWMMICGVASIFSYHISKAMNIVATQSDIYGYQNTFGRLSQLAFIVGILLFFLSKKIDIFTEKENENIAIVYE